MAAAGLAALPDEAPGVTAKVPLQLCSMPSVKSNATFSPWLARLPLIRTLVAASRLSTALTTIWSGVSPARGAGGAGVATVVGASDLPESSGLTDAVEAQATADRAIAAARIPAWTVRMRDGKAFPSARNDRKHPAVPVTSVGYYAESTHNRPSTRSDS